MTTSTVTVLGECNSLAVVEMAEEAGKDHLPFFPGEEQATLFAGLEWAQLTYDNLVVSDPEGETVAVLVHRNERIPVPYDGWLVTQEGHPYFQKIFTDLILGGIAAPKVLPKRTAEEVLNTAGQRIADGLRAQVRDLAGGRRPVFYDEIMDGLTPMSEVLYEKCLYCHLFVDENPAFQEGVLIGGMTIATHVHLHRGDDADEALDGSHEPTPSGRRANLLTWKTYGPVAMRERFTE